VKKLQRVSEIWLSTRSQHAKASFTARPNSPKQVQSKFEARKLQKVPGFQGQTRLTELNKIRGLRGSHPVVQRVISRQLA